MSQNVEPRPLLKPAEVAARLRISKSGVYRLLATGELPGCVRIGRTVRVRADALDKLASGQQADAKGGKR